MAADQLKTPVTVRTPAFAFVLTDTIPATPASNPLLPQHRVFLTHNPVSPNTGHLRHCPSKSYKIRPATIMNPYSPTNSNAASATFTKPLPAWLRNAGLFWLAATLVVLFIGIRQALFIVPPDAELGDVQRIFYYHLPFAILGMVFPYVNLVASLAYLYLRNRDPFKALTADALALASAQTTVLYTSLGLMTGMLYAKPVWGIWWTWDARLTTYFILWLLYVSYLLTRKLAPPEQIAPLSSVLAIFAAVDIPIVYMSIRWWRTQHPAPVFGSNDPNHKVDPALYPAVAWNIAGWLMWGIFILTLRFLIERRRQHAEQENALRAIEASLEDHHHQANSEDAQ